MMGSSQNFFRTFKKPHKSLKIHNILLKLNMVAQVSSLPAQAGKPA